MSPGAVARFATMAAGRYRARLATRVHPGERAALQYGPEGVRALAPSQDLVRERIHLRLVGPPLAQHRLPEARTPRDVGPAGCEPLELLGGAGYLGARVPLGPCKPGVQQRTSELRGAQT